MTRELMPAPLPSVSTPNEELESPLDFSLLADELGPGVTARREPLSKKQVKKDNNEKIQAERKA
jgi:hypothetical protein